MTAAPRFPLKHPPVPRHAKPGLWRAIAHRSTWALWSAALGAIMALNVARYIGIGFHAPAQTPVGELPLDDLPGFVLVTGCECVCLVMAVLIADELVERGAPRRRSYLLAAAGASLVAAIAHCLVRLPFDVDAARYSRSRFVVWCAENAIAIFVDQLLVCGLAIFVYVSLREAHRAGARRHVAEIARLSAKRRALESRLQAMQARVEPRFLFNTLAQVRRLYESDPETAGKMLEDLIAYLRAALPQLRDSTSTLGKEAALARAYLEIVRVRLENRLAFDVSVPPALADARMPPMMLLPLIDHALAHGAAPSRQGGTIRVEAAAADGRLRLSIIDSGAGFAPGAEAGPLAAIAERLQALYGDGATLRLERLPRRGTRAVLEIPHEATDGGYR